MEKLRTFWQMVRKNEQREHGYQYVLNKLGLIHCYEGNKKNVTLPQESKKL